MPIKPASAFLISSGEPGGKSGSMRTSGGGSVFRLRPTWGLPLMRR
jgi:hypothetical protein